MQILPLAAAFVGYIVFWNLSLQLNSVGFYQLSKILIAPAIITIEAVWFKKVPTRMEVAAVSLLCLGVALATIADAEVCQACRAHCVSMSTRCPPPPDRHVAQCIEIRRLRRGCCAQVSANLTGVLMSGLAIWTTSIYQIWAGSKQEEYQASYGGFVKRHILPDA